MRTIFRTYTVVEGGQDGTHLPVNYSHGSTAHAGTQHHTSLAGCALFSVDSSTVLLYSLVDQSTTETYR